MPPNEAQQRLARLLEDICLEIAEMTADSHDSHSRTVERAHNLRARVSTVSKMAGLGELPEYRVEREIRRVAG